MRERMEMHRSQPSCNACHGIMDPLGLSLENFDAVGQWRDKDPRPARLIDASGKLADGTAVNGPDDLRKALLARSGPVRADPDREADDLCTGPPVDYHDMPTVRAIVRDAAPTTIASRPSCSASWTVPRSRCSSCRQRRAPAQAAMRRSPRRRSPR